MISTLAWAAVREVAIDSLIAFAGLCIAVALIGAAWISWRRTARKLSRLADLSDDSVDPSWPGARKTLRRPDGTEFPEEDHDDRR